MKLRNKRTGEVVSIYEILTSHNTLAELNSEWEDYEEPKTDALHVSIIILTDAFENHPDEWNDPEAGIKFVEKLKAYKRLKDKGFRFESWEWKTQKINYELDFRVLSEEGEKEAEQDLDLLFGGEE